jgi:hypothetical protein
VDVPYRVYWLWMPLDVGVKREWRLDRWYREGLKY